MANRKTVEQRIAESQEKIRQEQNALKQLQKQQGEQDRKARNHRLCKRHGLIESLLPDTAILTDEQFQIFLEQHIANSHGRSKLASIVEQGKNNQSSNITETAAQSASPTPAKPPTTETQPNNATPPKPAPTEEKTNRNAPAGTKQGNGNPPKHSPHNVGANSPPQGTPQGKPA